MMNNTSTRKRPIDPHHCRCFSILKPHFLEFESKMLALGYYDPLFEEDHGQILSFAKRITEYSQIHIKLMRTGRIEAEIEPPHDYPMAHLNSIHSYPAHHELHVLLPSLQIPFKCKKAIPDTCIRRQIVVPQQPTHIGTFLTTAAVAAGADLLLNDGKYIVKYGTKALNFVSDEVTKSLRRKQRRRKYLI